jgi:hypothetical protein
MQEATTAQKTVQQAALEGAEVEIKGSQGPLVVTVRTAEGAVLWQASQKKLFRKYGEDRLQSIEEITKAVREHVQKV